MNKLGEEWYFGLNTALRLNGAKQFSPVIHVLSDAIYKRGCQVHKDEKAFLGALELLRRTDKILGSGSIFFRIASSPQEGHFLNIPGMKLNLKCFQKNGENFNCNLQNSESL